MADQSLDPVAYLILDKVNTLDKTVTREMTALRNELHDASQEQTAKVQQLEDRVDTLEEARSQLTGVSKLGYGVLTVLTSSIAATTVALLIHA